MWILEIKIWLRSIRDEGKCFLRDLLFDKMCVCESYVGKIKKIFFDLLFFLKLEMLILKEKVIWKFILFYVMVMYFLNIICWY